MIRYGASAQKMQPIPAREFFTLRIKLLIIMTKASLKGNPLGDYRKKAIVQTARYVFSHACAQAKEIKKMAAGESPAPELQKSRMDTDQYFLKHIQLLAVMANALVNGKAPGRFRKQAMKKNIDWICMYMSKHKRSVDTLILKVA